MSLDAHVSRMSAAETLHAARAAIDEYNAMYLAGGEMDFPQWAVDILNAADRPTVAHPNLNCRCVTLPLGGEIDITPQTPLLK